jgi:hypothetical protein
LSVKRRERSLKYKTKEGWKKVIAPLYDPKCQQSVYVLKFLLKLFGYEVKESRTTVIPFAAFQDGIRNPKNQLPTVNLIVNPPLTFPYGLQKSSLSCIYWGEEWFLILGKSEDENEKEKLNLLISDIEKLYPVIRDCVKRKDYKEAQEIFNRYYKIEVAKPVKKESEIAVKPIEKKEERVEIIIEKDKPKLTKTTEPQQIVPQPMQEKREESEEREEIVETPIYSERMELEIEEYRKTRYNPNDFYGQAVPWIDYEIIQNFVKMKLATEEERRKAIILLFVHIKRDCKMDEFGKHLIKELSNLRNQIELRFNRRFRQAQ